MVKLYLKNMKKYFIIFLILFVLLPSSVRAQDSFSDINRNSEEIIKTSIDSNEAPGSGEEIFEAKVVEILQEKEVENEDGSKSIQQNIKLKGLKGKWKDKEIIFYGISDIDVIAKTRYKEGEKVLVSHTKDMEGQDKYYIIDYVRRGSLYFLAVIFALVIILIGKLKGLRALIALIISFVIIMKFIIPKILDGSSPLFTAITGSFFILFFILYITEGFNRRANLAIVSILISLFITGLLSLLFTSMTKLTGFAQEETVYLITSGYNLINVKGLLLAGIIIGTLGVLDDVVISQISAIEQIKKANPELSKKQIYQHALQIGKSHLGSMVNTLFLAYAGAALPLLLLFTIKQPPFLTFNQVINNEVIATEVVRTLVGSIGLTLAIPISSYLAAYFLKIKRKN